MKRRTLNSRLGPGVLGVLMAHLRTGFNCWLKTLCIPLDVLFFLQYSQMWVKEQFHESHSGSWQKDVEQ
jgi:hypothetical protein